jgi:hypothetical protein
MVQITGNMPIEWALWPAIRCMEPSMLNSWVNHGISANIITKPREQKEIEVYKLAKYR